MNKSRVRAGVIGARGYTGREVVRLIEAHPALELAFATSERDAGREVSPGGARYRSIDDVDFGSAELVFTCLPTGRSAEWSVRAREAGPKVIDLSQDLRPSMPLDSSEPEPEPQPEPRYGLPELWRDELQGADLVANPGCYVTGVLLALAPVVRAGAVDGARPIVISAASGVTGAGRTPKADLLFGEVAGDYRAYGVGNRHRHVREMRAGLGRVAGLAGVPQFVFTPHLLPVRRGILETIHLPLAGGVSPAEAAALWRDAYAAEPFVTVLEWNETEPRLPTLADAVGTNRVVIGCAPVEGIEPPSLLVVVALDNLLKGAAGQAVQNANLMLGLDEREGLDAWAYAL